MFEAVKETSKHPVDPQLTDGFCPVDPLGVPPSKVQLQAVGVPSEVSVKLTLAPVAGVTVEAVKSAVGPGTGGVIAPPNNLAVVLRLRFSISGF
jgi:hypothetical protein